MINAKMTSFAVAAVLASALSLAAATTSTDALAASGVKCYGISKAGENGCANKAGTHSCAGHSTVDYDGGEWKITASADTCVAEDGELEPFDGINPAKA